MRNFLAVILAIITGVTASFGLVSWKLSEAIHQPEPIQDILGSGEAAQDFKNAVPETLGNMATGTTNIVVVDDAINRAVTEASAHVVAHEDFDQAWSESLELTRVGWLDTVGELRAQLDAGEQLDDNATDAQLELRLDPVTDLTLSMVEDAVAEATSGIPGIENVSLDLETDLTTTVPTPIPPVNMLTAAQVVQAEELMTVWPAILALAAIVFVMALVMASRGSRWMVWLVTGLVAAISGAAVKLAYSWMQNFVLDRAADTTHATLLRPFLRAIQDWADPQILVLIAAAVGIALIGILGGFIASNRRGRR